MASPQFGVHVILPKYGNVPSGGYSNGAPAAIEHGIFTGMGSGTSLPPSLTVPPMMPLLERLTPRSMNATAVSASAFGRARSTAARLQRKTGQFTTGYLRALGMQVPVLGTIAGTHTTATHLPTSR